MRDIGAADTSDGLAPDPTTVLFVRSCNDISQILYELKFVKTKSINF